MRFAATVFLMILVSTGHAFAGECPIDSLTAFKRSVNQTGKEFYVTFPPVLDLPTDTIATHTLVMYGLEYQEVTVYSAKTGYTETRALKPYEIVRWELPYDAAQVYRHNSNANLAGDTVFDDAAVYVQAEQAIALMVETRIGNKFGRYTATARETAGKEFVVVSLPEKNIGESNSALRLPATVYVVGLEDNTIVTVFNRTNVGEEAFTIDKGDVLHFSTDSLGTDVSGTWIQSTLPVTVTSSMYEVFESQIITNCDVGFVGAQAISEVTQTYVTKPVANLLDSTLYKFALHSENYSHNFDDPSANIVGDMTIISSNYSYSDTRLIEATSMIRSGGIVVTKTDSGDWNSLEISIFESWLANNANSHHFLRTDIYSEFDSDSTTLEIMVRPNTDFGSIGVFDTSIDKVDTISMSDWLQRRSVHLLAQTSAFDIYHATVPTSGILGFLSEVALHVRPIARPLASCPTPIAIHNGVFYSDSKLEYEVESDDRNLHVQFFERYSDVCRALVYPINAQVDSMLINIDGHKSHSYWLSRIDQTEPFGFNFCMVGGANFNISDIYLINPEVSVVESSHADSQATYIAPNPVVSESKLFLGHLDSPSVDIRFVHLTGIIHSSQHADADTVVDIPKDLPPGMWFARIVDGDKQVTVPFIVK